MTSRWRPLYEIGRKSVYPLPRQLVSRLLWLSAFAEVAKVTSATSSVVDCGLSTRGGTGESFSAVKPFVLCMDVKRECCV